MVLYHASTMYHLLSCIVHKLAYHSDEQAELLVLEYIKPQKERYAFLTKLNDFGFFSKVRYVPEQKFKLKKGIALDENSTEKEINTVINNIASAFESWFNSDIENYSDIYVASDQHSCGIYLIKNNIPYTYMEDASGMLSEQSRYLSITKNNNLTNHIVNERLGCMGRNNWVKAKLCDIKHQQKGFYDPKAVDFCIYDILKNIIPDKIPVLLKFFGNISATVKSNKKVCLFLTQDLNTLTVKDIDLQELMTTTLVDYFCPDCTLIIKPHPKDRWQNYKRIFKDAVLLEKGIPSELLPFAIEGKIDLALTASSTSIRGMTEFTNKTYSFTTEIETNRDRIDDMFAGVEVLKKVGITNGVCVRNINEEQILNFLDSRNILKDGQDILIDGGITRQENFDIGKYKLAMFLNLGNILNYNPKNSFENLFVITADFTGHPSSLISEKQVMIFVYCNDDEISKNLNGLSFSLVLKNTKADVKINCTKATKEIADKLEAKLKRDIEWEEI